MKNKKLTVLLVMVFAAISQPVSARLTGSELVWKKRVRRTVPLRLDKDNKYDTSGQAKWAAFFERLIKDVAAGRVDAHPVAYEPFNTKTKISPGEVSDMVKVTPDTIWHEAAKKGKGRVPKPVNRPYDYKRIRNIRTVEEWTYDPVTGETDMQILAIAPYEDVYNHDDGTFRGSRAMFWIKWDNLQKYLDNGGQGHKDIKIERTILHHVLRGPSLHMDTASCDGAGTRCQGLVTRKVIPVNDSSSAVSRLALADDFEVTMSEVLFFAVRSGRTKAYTKTLSGDIAPLTMDDLEAITTYSTDTVYVVDPIDGTETRRLMTREVNFNNWSKYYLQERWQFDAPMGTIKFTNQYLGVVEDDYGRTEQSVEVIHFWLQYPDARCLLRDYNQAHPRDGNIEWQVWHDRFE